MQVKIIDGLLFKELLAAGTKSLFKYQKTIDALNVFPVPDGDTGTNMYLTFQAALKEVNQNETLNLSELLEAAAFGALMGARGNSGVILSQLIRGFVKGVTLTEEVLTKKEIIEGLNSASHFCYKAVRKPVEGTMLTIIREVAEFAATFDREEITLVDFIEKLYRHADQSLANTPDLLPILKKAGVVDAGGHGLVCFFQGIIQYLRGEIINNDEQLEIAHKIIEGRKGPDLGALADDLSWEKSLSFNYCTEFILKGKRLNAEVIQDFLTDQGDSLLVVGDEEILKIHIHTNNPGIILDFGVKLGSLSEIKIDNMLEQSQKNLKMSLSEEEDPAPVGILAVAVGDGLERIFGSMGAQQIVSGGQTMNPSIEELVKAVNALAAPEVIILPNNSNIILTANQVQQLVDKEVRVIPSETIPEGITALLNFSPSKTLAENTALMTSGLNNIITGEVTYAVRSLRLGTMNIDKGDIIGLVNGEIQICGRTSEEVLLNTIEKIPAALNGLLTIYYGKDVDALTAERVVTNLNQSFPEAEVEVHYGGQPLYYYLFSVE